MAVVEMFPGYGIAAFFDILGYRNLILNNKLDEYVTSKFRAHSKGLPNSVLSKVKNTKEFLQFLKLIYEP